MKKCFVCKKDKELDEFYRHPETKDGHLGKCKECTKGQSSRHYYDTHEARILYERKRRPRTKIQVKYKTESELKYQKKANTAVQAAIKKGVLLKQPCEVCGTCQNIQAHHDDYSKPLEVRWLCPKHHAEFHKHNSNIWRPILDKQAALD